MALFRVRINAEFELEADSAQAAQRQGQALADALGENPSLQALGVHFAHIDYPHADEGAIKPAQSVGELLNRPTPGKKVWVRPQTGS